MKLYILIIAVALFTIGCSSNDDNPPLNDPGTTTGDGTTTGGDVTTPLFSEEKLTTLLPKIFSVVRAAPFENFIQTTDGLPVPLETNLIEDLEGFQETNIQIDESTSRTSIDYVCDSGGSVAFTILRQASGAEFYPDHTADMCVVGSRIYNGQRLSSTRSSGRSYEFPEGFTIDSTNSRRTLKGSRVATNATARPNGTLAWSIDSFTSDFDGDPSQASFDSDLKFNDLASDPAESKLFSVSFELDASWSNNKVITGNTLKVFSDFGDQNTYEKGQLEVSSSDGSKILIDADNGDPSSYQVTIETDGASSSITRNWDNDSDLPCLSAFAVADGLIDNKGCVNVFQQPAPITRLLQ